MRGPPDERSPAQLLSFGVVNLDKPPGPSSHELTHWVREFTNEALANAGAGPIERAAHAGTLDPKVTGSLPTMLGVATRLARLFDKSIKEYVAVLELHGPAPANFEEVLGEFEDRLYQRPPRKSAVRRRRRIREVYDIAVLERESHRALIRVRCEAGTYIRKLCHDIGLALGTGAHMGELRRTGTGQFDDTTLVSMETFVDALAFWHEDDDPGPLYEIVSPAEVLLRDLPRITIAASAAREVAEGAPVYAPGVIDVQPPKTTDSESVTTRENGLVNAAEAPPEKKKADAVSTDGELVACYTPDGAAVCLGTVVGDPTASAGTVVELERVLV